MSFGLIVALALIGFVAGTLGSLVGLGGGFVIVPMLTLLFALPSKFAAGTSVSVIVITSIASVWVYHKHRRIDWRSGIGFAIASIPGAFLGAHFSHALPSVTFHRLFGTFLILVSVFLLVKPNEAKRSLFSPTSSRRLVDDTGKEHTYTFNFPVGLVAAFFVGFLSSLFGIGGGTVMVPTMVLALGFPAHVAVATSMVVVFTSATVGTISHAFLGDVLWPDSLFLATGAVFGGYVGSKLSARISARLLLRILAVLIIVAALKMMMS